MANPNRLEGQPFENSPVQGQNLNFSKDLTDFPPKQRYFSDSRRAAGWPWLI